MIEKNTVKMQLAAHLSKARIEMETAFSIAHNTNDFDVRCFSGPIYFTLQMICKIHLEIPGTNKSTIDKLNTILDKLTETEYIS